MDVALEPNSKPGRRWNRTKKSRRDAAGIVPPDSLTMIEVDRWGESMQEDDWTAMDRLHAIGFIFDPKSKARSVGVVQDV